MNSVKWFCILVLAGVILPASAIPAAAQTPSTASATRWEFTVAPYFLAPYMSGELGVRNLSVPVDASPGDIFDKLQFGAMLYLEARKGPWGAFVDGLYMDLEQTAQNVGATASATQGAVEVSVFRRVTPALDVLVGARVNSLDGGITFPTPATSVSQSSTWVDPVVGIRLRAPVPAPWQLGIMADIGGFGVGSKLAWQIYPVAGVRLSRLVSVHLAYRVLDMDYGTGSGTDTFAYNMRTFGPEIGLAFHF